MLHFEGLPPPSSHTFLAKSEGVNPPPLCSYIIRNVGSTPPTPEPVGVGDANVLIQLLSLGSIGGSQKGRSVEASAAK